MGWCGVGTLTLPKVLLLTTLVQSLITRFGMEGGPSRSNKVSAILLNVILISIILEVSTPLSNLRTLSNLLRRVY